MYPVYRAYPVPPAVHTQRVPGDMQPESTPFILGGCRFDLDTFSGRLRNICAQLDPRKCLVSRAELARARQLLDDFKQNPIEARARVGDDHLWCAQELLAARTHPDTGKEIFLPLCFAAYAPMQPPIVLGMLWKGGGVLNQAFWQWYNASYNAMVGYANKNASVPMSDSEIFMAYVAAVGTSVGLSVGMQSLGKHKAALRMAAPFVGCVGGSCASLVSMRYNELIHGVMVRDASGTEHGMSVVAARDGILKCCLARVAWNIPILVVTPQILLRFDRRFPRASPATRLSFELLVTTMMIFLSIYPAQAIFKQEASLPASRLESRFQGKGVDTYYYNKGL
eukprot:Sspe_Gene.100968::Locus_75605_Transcript_3_3_Confidence_0.714_Length_1850::g.100968::m.100968